MLQTTIPFNELKNQLTYLASQNETINIMLSSQSLKGWDFYLYVKARCRREIKTLHEFRKQVVKSKSLPNKDKYRLSSICTDQIEFMSYMATQPTLLQMQINF